jgi:hypothetical protein
MDDTEKLILQSLQLEDLNRIALEMAQYRQEAQSRGRYSNLPEWIDLEQAVTLKRGICAGKKRAGNGKAKDDSTPITGGAALTTYRQKLFLQPCCGHNYRMIGGRRCWKKDDVIKWLSITDEDLLVYAESHGVKLPEVYADRAKTQGIKR